MPLDKIQKEQILNVDTDELEMARKLLSSMDYELLEICHIDEKHTHDIWTCDTQTVKINITGTGDEQSDDEPDATRNDVIHELIDLWLELRAIKRLLSNSNDQYDLDIEMPETSFQIFSRKSEHFRNERREDVDVWNFFFKSGIDEYVCAYLDLEEDERKQITH